nr:hypothetical protein [Tanacetum cinerariifolium]
MSTLKFANTHNLVVILEKPTESEGFKPECTDTKVCLTVNPTIYDSCIEQFYSTAMAKTINKEAQIHAWVDGKEIIITKSSVRRDLRLADEEGVEYFLNSTTFENFELMGTMASAIICLATNQKFNFSKLIFDSMIRNLDNVSGKFLMYLRLVRAATTASSLEAEQDNGNIDKTQSKATPNEASSPKTTLGGGPMCQEAMGDTITQTRFENVSKHSNDSLLARGNTLQIDEDRMKLNELMELCTNLQTRVLYLEKTKTTQALEITSLKRRVKKLENKQRSRTHKIKRLYKIGLTARVDSSKDKQSLGEDASKQERKINDIDADEDITLVNDQDDAEIFDVNNLHGEEVFVEKEVANKEVNDEVQKVAEEVVEDTNTANLIVDAAQKMFDRAFNRVNTFVDFRTELVEGSSKIAGEELSQESVKKQKVDDDKETAELKQLMKIILSEKEIAIDAIPLALKSPKIFDWKIHKEGKKTYYQIIRADGNSKMYIVFNRMLKEFDKEDLEDLYNLVDDDKETAELKQLMKIILSEKEIAINAIPLALKSPKIFDWKIHKEGKKTYYQIIRADGNSKMYMVFNRMLKEFDKEDLEDLYNLVKDKY